MEWNAGDYFVGSSGDSRGVRGCSSWVSFPSVGVEVPLGPSPTMRGFLPNRIVECGHCGYQTVIGDLSKAGLTVLKCPECAGPLKV